MFALVIVGLIIAVLFVLAVLCAMFLGVAFEDPETSRVRREQAAVKDTLAKVARVRIDAADPSSPTYGKLTRQAAMKHWTGQKRGVS